MTQRGYGPCDLVEANPWPVAFADSAALETQGEQQMRLWISF